MFGHDEDRFVNTCDSMPDNRGVHETKDQRERSVGVYMDGSPLLATSRSPRKQSGRFWPFQQHAFRAKNETLQRSYTSDSNHASARSDSANSRAAYSRINCLSRRCN